MGNRKKARLTYHEIPDQPRQEPQKQKHEYVSYVAATDRRLKVSTGFVMAEEPSGSHSTAEDHDQVPDIEEDEGEDDKALDPAYLEHLAEMSAEESSGHKKRHRTAAVGLKRLGKYVTDNVVGRPYEDVVGGM
jgi:hypothetical protein